MSSSRHLNRCLDEDLSQFEDKIKKAYVLKALNAQLTEQKAERMAMDVQARAADKIEQYRAEAEYSNRCRVEEMKRAKRESEMKAKLIEQVEEKRQKQIATEEEARLERRTLVAVDRAREKREECERFKKKEQLAEQLLLKYLIQREIREINKHKLQEQEVEESAKNEKYIKKLKEEKERIEALRVEANHNREKLILTVVEILLKLQRDTVERRRLITELVIEEVKRETEIEAREVEQCRIEKMQDYRHDLEQQIQFEKECKLRFLEREKEFAETIMTKIMESKKMKQLTVEACRRRRVEYREELDWLMKERERIRLEELGRLYLALEKEIQQEDESKKEARRARITLLEHHIENIAEYMSKKSLNEEERLIINSFQKDK